MNIQESSSYFQEEEEEDNKQNYLDYSFHSSHEEYDLSKNNDDNEDDVEQLQQNDEMNRRIAFDISREEYNSSNDDNEDEQIYIENILDEIQDQQNNKEIEYNTQLNHELYYFNHYMIQQNEIQNNINNGLNSFEQQKYENKESLVQKIRDSVEIRKRKSSSNCINKSIRASICNDTATDITKIYNNNNINNNSFFNSCRLHDFSLPIKRGYLLKKSPTIFQGFQKRYCTLDKQYFNYFLPDNHSTIFGSINLQITQIKIEEIRDPASHILQEFKLIPLNCDKQFHFKSCDGNSQILEEWIDAIKQHIESAKYYIHKYKMSNLIKQFWKQPLISEDQFKQECETGDLILFKNNNIGSALQRTFSASEYDHVALILKYKCGKIVLFECNTLNGVSLTPWESLSTPNWPKQFEKISYRKLHFRRTIEQIQGIFEFMKSNLGKQFDASAIKILKSGIDRMKSQKNEKSQESIFCKNEYEQRENNNSYFCSELVASCYQSIQLLPSNIPTHSYWPTDFSQKKKLPFLQLAHFSCEYTIIQTNPFILQTPSESGNDNYQQIN